MLGHGSRHFRTRLVTSCATAALCAGAAQAQTPQSDTNIEQVVVSGSRVTIAGYSQPTPVTVVGAAELAKNAYSNIADSVRQLPQVASPPSSFNNESSFSGGGHGTNTVNLRNLGFARTLVLLDSQRVVATNISGGVDTTLLPATLVSRIDVVTGGASAAWGSDAVAGVVNFVLNKNFTGFKATIQASATKNARQRNAFMEAAWGDDIFGGRGHIEFAANADFKPDTVLLSEQNWFSSSYFVSNPAYVPGTGQTQLIVAHNVGLASASTGGIINSSPAGTAGPGVTAAPANALRGIQFIGNGIPERINYGNLTNNTISNGGSLDRSNTQSSWSIIANPSFTYTAFAYGRYKLTDAIQASAMINLAYFKVMGGSGNAGQSALVIKSDNAFIPASVRATMQAGGITSFSMGTLVSNNFDTTIANSQNFSDMAQRSLAPSFARTRRNMARGVFTLEGRLGEDWSWNAYTQYSTARIQVKAYANPIQANLNAAEDAVTVTTANRGTSGFPLGSVVCRSSLPGAAPVVIGTVTAEAGCIPLNVFGVGVASPAAIAYINGFSTGSATQAHLATYQAVTEGSMQGVLPWELPAGKVAVAFGVGYRKESAWQTTTAIGRQVGYASGNFPTYDPAVSYNVMEGFAEIDAPLLKDSIVNSLDISMAGRMTSYSTSGLVETWKLGATSQINDDIKLRTTWSVDIRAPQLSELFSPGSSGCGAQRDPKTQVTILGICTITSGNPNLLPEVARTISGGVVLTPRWIDGFSLSADWYSINLTGAIASIGAATVLNECNPTQPSVVHPGQPGNPNDPLCAFLDFNGPGGALSRIRVGVINFASNTVSGLDIQANYSMDFWDGTLDWSAVANYTDENTISNPATGVNDIAGSNNVGGGGLVAAGPKWKGVLGATYATGPWSFTTQARWYGTAVNYQDGNTGNKASAATANRYEWKYFHSPFVAYLDLRLNYKWNENMTFFGNVDNATSVPPPLLAPTSATTSNSTGAFHNANDAVFDLLGRTIKVGVRFAY